MTNADIFSALKTLTPTAKFGVKGDTYAGIEWFSDDVVKPTEQEVAVEIARQEAEKPVNKCKAEAKKLIAASDWSVLPDVGITNVAEFEAYRASLRALIKNPVAEPTFPTEPQPVWA